MLTSWRPSANRCTTRDMTRQLTLSICAAVAMLASCGPSSTQLKAARDALLITERARARSLKEERPPDFSCSTPDSPGPPGLKTREPVRWAGSAVTDLASGRVKVRPSSGWA